MNGAHDMGGMQGFGPIAPQPDEPVFHHRWEARVYALTAAVGPVGGWTLDEDRHAVEAVPGDEYLNASYYERWFTALRRLLVRHGLVSEEELASGRAIDPAQPGDRVLHADGVQAFVNRIPDYSREVSSEAAFAPGDRVRARNMHPPGHTRLPRYARGAAGVIRAVRGAHVFPDSNAHDLGEDPQWLYSVAFTAQALWGDGQPERTEVIIDLWEPYLEPAR